MQINVAVTDANNIVCQVVPPQTEVITIDRGVAGNGIVSIVPVTISTFQYLRITYTNGTVQDVGPLTSTAYTATAPITIVGNTISLATVPIASGGTDATTAAGAIQNLLPSYTGNANKRLGLNSTATGLEWVLDGGGTVTSIAASGGTTGLTFSGSPITTSGTLTLGGTLGVSNGGTGATTAGDALTNLGAIGAITSTDGSVTITSTGTSRDLSVAVAAATNNVIAQVRNTTGATLAKGTVVYISGATGQVPTVSKAIATGDATSAQTLGMITADLPNNSNGNVTIIGLITNIDTSAYTDGAQLYLSGTTAGAVTATKPYAPIHLVYVAVVEYAHPTQGKLFVKVQNGYELDEIHDVSIVSPVTGQTLVYNSTTDLWVNNTVSLTAGVNGTLPIANGGTGQTTANAALNALLPTQTGNASKYLQTDGTNATWDAISLSTADITGILPTANGGTGLGGATPFTANGLVYASSASALTTGSALTFNGTTFSNTGSTTLGDNSADSLTVNATVTSNLIFTDNTYDIGANGATRPRNAYFSKIVTAGQGTGNDYQFLAVDYGNASGGGMYDGIYTSSIKAGTYQGFGFDTRYQNAGSWQSSQTYASIIDGYQGQFRVFTNNGLTAGTPYTPTLRFIIGSNGLATFQAGVTDPSIVNNITVAAQAGGTAYGGFIGQRLISGDQRQGMFVRGSGSLTLLSQYNIDFLANQTSVPLAADTGLAMRINQNGTVAIGGTTANTYPLEVWKSTASSTQQDMLHLFQSAAGSAEPAIRFTTGNGLLGRLSFLTVGANAGYFQVATGDGTSAVNRLQILNNGNWNWNNVGSSSGGTAMTLNSTGLGLGTSSPAYKLQVAGTVAQVAEFTSNATATAVRIDNTNASGWGGNLAFYSNGTGAGFVGTIGSLIGSTAQDITMWATSGNGVRFYTNGNNERMRVTSGGDVGIGTSSPLAKLDSRGTVIITSNANGDNVLAFGNTSVFGGALSGAPSGSYGNAFIVGESSTGSGAPSLLKFYTTTGGSVSERARIDSVGNFGIGTTSPATRLDVINNATYQLRLASATGNYSNGGLYLGSLGTSDPYYYGYMRWDQSDICLKIGSQHGNGVGGIVFYTAGGTAGQSERMRITYNGEVGIGTSSPGQRLDVNGNIRVRDGGVSLTIGTAQQGVFCPYNRITGTGTDYTPTVFAETGLGITFAVNGSVAKAMTLDANSNLAVGTTTNAGKLTVGGKIRALSGDIELDSGQLTTNSTANALRFGVDGIEKARISSNGQLLVGLSSPPASASVGVYASFNSASYGVIGARNGSGRNTFAVIGDSNFECGYLGTSSPTGTDALLEVNGTNGVRFTTSATERARITPTGQLQVGTTQTVTDNYAGTTYPAVVSANGLAAIGLGNQGSTSRLSKNFGVAPGNTYTVRVYPSDTGYACTDIRLGVYCSAGSGSANSFFCYGGHTGAYQLNTVFNSFGGNTSVSAVSVNGAGWIQFTITITGGNAGQAVVMVDDAGATAGKTAFIVVV